VGWIPPYLLEATLKRAALLVAAAVAAATVLWVVGTQTASATSSANAVTVPVTRVGSASLTTGSPSNDPAVDLTEIDSATNGDTDSGNTTDESDGVNRSLPSVTTGHGKAVNPGKKAKSNPTLGVHFEGLNLQNQRFANGGNQFSVEPPDQALCAGNGFIVEAVNDVFRAYHTDGSAATGVIDLNTFYNYPPAIVRTGPHAGERGPSITDPVCLFDAATQRFFLVVLTLDHVGLTAATNGNNHLDIAVSNSADPTGGWTIFTLPVQNNGTQGTPNHNCGSGFCLGDYPHIGADANGIYLTTNEFAFSGPGFYGAQMYGISKNLLLGGVSGSAVLFNTLGVGPDGAGFTVWPATVPGTTFATANNGSEYFLSSRAVFDDDGVSDSILQWTMSNTASLNSSSPAVNLSLSEIAVNEYAVPPRANQPAGNRPLSQCLADTVTNCWATVAGATAPNNTTFGPPNGQLNSNDSRMQQVMYANGKLWGALDTAVNVGGQSRAGIAYYVVNPTNAKLVLQGQAGLTSTDLTYPAIGVTDSGRGVIAFTLTGDNDYPSAAYASLDAQVGLGDVSVAAAGAGPWDGFTSYVVFRSGRPRWGDYGATSVVGNTIYTASEYVAQTCTYDQYLNTAPVGQCGGSRAPLGNWSTHISAITP
jgi:hypothetical protein